jgi:hypothetical protein
MEWHKRFVDFAVIGLLFSLAAHAGPSSTKNVPGDQIKRSGGAILSLPNVTDTLTGRLSTDTLTNKTLLDGSNSWANTADPTKKFQWSLSGVSTGTTRTLTVPNASTTIVGTDTTQTLSNKSLSDALQFDQIATPSTPAAGKQKLYPKSDGKFYTAKSDGTESALGSGSGGSAGYNMLVDSNPDLETGTSSLTASGGSLTTASGASALFGLKSASWDASAAAQTLSTASITIPTGLQGGNCLARLAYKGGDANLTLEVFDGTNVVASQVLSVASQTTFVSASFVCPSSGSLLLRLKASADAASVTIDQLHLGENFLLGTVSQATFVGSITYPVATNCAWSTTSSSYGNFSADTDCGTPTVEGAVSAPGTKIPAAVLSSAPSGRYFFVATGVFYEVNSTANQTTGAYRFSDGTNSSQEVGIQQDIGLATGGVSESSAGTILGEINYTTAQGSTTFNIQGKAISASVTMFIDLNNVPMKISIYRYPSVSEMNFRTDVLNFKIDASIGGDNPSLGGSAVTTPAEWTASTFTLVQNAGSSAVKIACPSTETASGTTCATTEVPGVVFDAPVAGVYEACFSLTHEVYINAGSSGSLGVAWYLVETADGSSTILQTGKDVVQSGQKYVNDATLPVRSCSDFTFASAGKKAIKIYRAQSAISGTNTVMADRDANLGGGRDIHLTVKLKSQYTAVPVFVGSVTSNSTGPERVERATIANAGSASITSQSGSWLTSVSRSALGRVTTTIAAGIFSATPTCVCTNNAPIADSAICQLINDQTSTVLHTYTGNNGAGADNGFTLICMGPR